MASVFTLPLLTLVIAVTGACARERSPQDQVQVEELAKTIVPDIERAVGLKFRSPPIVAVRTREQVRRYLENKFNSELPAEELDGLTAAYRLFGLLPDTLDVRALLLALYGEQVVGYFDPDSSTLYVVSGADPAAIQVTLAHELVHALQGQYVHLDSILSMRGDNDRRVAAQAVMEGQATFVMVGSMLQDRNLEAVPDLWRTAREAMRREQERMPVFSGAPLIFREGLMFPYIGGADFIRWFRQNHPDTVPFGARMPVSTEQILHPEQYHLKDAPVGLAFRDAEDAVYEDNLGEFEVRILLTELTGSESTGAAGARGWGGDRYAVLPAGTVERALVWWSVWDTPQAAAKFRAVFEPGWKKRVRAGRRFTIDAVELSGQPAIRFVDAPVGWGRWGALPGIVVR